MSSASYRGGGGALEGLGGPIQMDPYTTNGIDPCLEDCCRREVENNRRYNVMTSTLRRHDVIALTERRRRNLVQTVSFEGCRCCYDPNSDGTGDYRALIQYKQQQKENDNKEEEDVDDDAPTAATFGVENTEPNATMMRTENTKEFDNKTPKNDDTSDDDDDDSEFDYLLDEDFTNGIGNDGNNNNTTINPIQQMEEQRRMELQFQMLTRQVALQHGYGTHRQLHPVRVLKAAGFSLSTSNNNNNNNRRRPPPPAVVLHLVNPDSNVSASLDYFLETQLAPKYPGTIFLRSGGRSTLLMDNALAKQALPQLFATAGQNHNDLEFSSILPTLIAIRNGQAVNICPKLRGLTTNNSRYYHNNDDNDDNDEEIDPHAVQHWLEMSGVLLSQPPQYMEELCFIRPEEEALMDYMTTTKKQESILPEERFDCGLPSCHKSFPHEHVGIQTSEQSGLVVKEDTILGE